jgi:hypothetical protein
MASALPAWWRLFRPHNAAIAGAGVWLGHAATDAEGLSTAAWGCLSMVLLTAAGNADNDVCDLQASGAPGSFCSMVRLMLAARSEHSRRTSRPALSSRPSGCGYW